MRRGLTGLRPVQRRALRIARRVARLSSKVAAAHGVARDPGFVPVRRVRPSARPPSGASLARMPAPAGEAAPVVAPVVDVDDGFRIEAPAAVAPPEPAPAPAPAPSGPPSPGPAPAPAPASAEPKPAATQTPGGTRLLRRAEPDPPPPDLPDDMRFLWDVWQREKPGGRGVLERGRGARILEGEAPREEAAGCGERGVGSGRRRAAIAHLGRAQRGGCRAGRAAIVYKRAAREPSAPCTPAGRSPPSASRATGPATTRRASAAFGGAGRADARVTQAERGHRRRETSSAHTRARTATCGVRANARHGRAAAAAGRPTRDRPAQSARRGARASGRSAAGSKQRVAQHGGPAAAAGSGFGRTP